MIINKIVLIILSIMLVSCAMDNDLTSETPVIDVNLFNSAIEKISNKKIYFGHQSVGNNIVSGITDLLSTQYTEKFVILDSQNTDDYINSMFGHSRVGYNTNPMSKIIGFSNFIDNLRFWKPDVATFKFCYVDIKSNTNVNELFDQYSARMAVLKEKYPGTLFLHTTVPLTTVQSGLKANIKKLIGKPIGGFRDNIARNKYNDLLRNKYLNKEPIFDLALIESTLPDGTRSKFEVDGTTYYSLAAEYASDGRHLNVSGRKQVASKFIELLAELP